jgi:hypothetical protein
MEGCNPLQPLVMQDPCKSELRRIILRENFAVCAVLDSMGRICKDAIYAGGQDMELIENQKQAIRQWAQDGCGLSEIQKKMSAEFGISLTFMDVRLLVLDLGIKLQEKSKAASVSLSANPAASGRADAAPTSSSLKDASATPKPEGGGVSVGIDRVTAPGSVVSGTVTFSDGISATWFLDQMGRLALNPGKPGYNPSQHDVQSFQRELRDALAKMGY